MIDTGSLEWKVRKLGENVDMLRRACQDNREWGFRKCGLKKPAMGRVKAWTKTN